MPNLLTPHAAPWLAEVRRWPADLQAEWQERAAIMEFCGKRPKHEAEKAAYECIARRVK